MFDDEDEVEVDADDKGDNDGKYATHIKTCDAWMTFQKLLIQIMFNHWLAKQSRNS